MPQLTVASSQPPWLDHRPRYRPDIEGLRAIAVLLIVAFHAGVPGFDGGFVGVDVFFVLSGYLITWLLVDEAERTGTVNLKRFYARRARRLLPALAIVLFATLAVTALLYAPYEQRILAKPWAATALYASNVYFANEAMNYHGASAETNPLLHTWSLSVEEQFYLVWPWLVLAGLGLLAWQRGRTTPGPRRLAGWLLAATAVSLIFSIYLTHTRGAWAFYLSPTRAWEFGAGGLAVLLPAARWPRRLLNPKLPGALARVLGWSGLVGLGLVATLYDSETPFPGTAALLPVISTVLVLRAGTSAPAGNEGRLHQILSLRPLQAIGKLSYSWYLWHWPILVFAAALADPLPVGWRLVAVTVSLVLAYASYTLVENPIRHSRTLAGSPVGSLAMGGAISFAAVAAAGLWWGTAREWSLSDSQDELTRVSTRLPAVYDNKDCDYDDRSSEVFECIYGDTTSSNTVLLIGDSHAMQFFPALRGAADENGWRLVVLTKSGCPFVDIPARYSVNLKRMYVECVIWRGKALDAVARIGPDLTFVGSSTQYRVHPETWEAGTRSVLSSLARGSHRVVQMLDPPVAAVDIPSCLARATWRWDPLDPDCRPRGKPRTELLVVAQQRAARAVPGVEILDVRDEVCVIGECEARADGVVRYRDDDHLSVEFAQTLTPMFAALLAGPQEQPATP